MPEMNSTHIASFEVRYLDINDYDEDYVERKMKAYKDLSINMRIAMWDNENQKIIKYLFNDTNYVVWTITKTKTKTSGTENKNDYTMQFNIEICNEDDDCNMRLLYLDQLICNISNTLQTNADMCNREIEADRADH